MDYGYLQIQVVAENTVVPLSNATIEITSTGNPDIILERLQTNEDGRTESVQLETPPLEYSQSPSDNQPYSCLLYTSPSPRD